MGCGCGKARGETITANVAQEMIERSRQEALQQELEAMVASVGRAIGNADSNTSAQR